MRRINRLLVAALLVLPLIWAAGPGDALAGSTQTGTLRGKVTGETGEPMPGVLVTFKSSALIRERATVTDTEGNFFAAGLPTGKYTVTYQLEGFLTIVNDTEVRLDKTTVIPIAVMQEGALEETVEVNAPKPVIDKTSTETSVLVEKSFTENLPVGRSYQSLIDFAPGVTGGSNPNMLGGTLNSNLYLIDGISGNDPVTGTFGFNLNFDAIEAVDIKLTGISAEYGQMQGGLTNLITKAGGNQFTGSVRDVITAPSWTKLYTSKSQDEFKPERSGGKFSYSRPSIPARSSGQDAKTNRFSTTFGGPIVTDRAWFYLAYDRPQRSQALPLGNPAGGPGGNGTYGDFFDGNFSLGKVTWQMTNDHRTQYYYSDDPATVTRCYGQIFFGGPCYEDYNVDLQKQGGYIWSATWNAVWTPSMVSDLRIARFRNTFLLSDLSPKPLRPGLHIPNNNLMGTLSGTGDIAPLIDLTTGTLFDAHIFADFPENRDRKQAEGSMTMFFDTRAAGSHTVKIGADYQEQERIGASIIDGNALFYSLGWAIDAPPGLGGAGNPYDINNRIYYLWVDFAPPTQVGPITEYTVLYVQDDWQLNDHWSFNLGLRWEDSNNENDVGEKIISDDGFAPRLGATFDITGEGKHVVKGTAARYLDGINLSTISPFVRQAGGQSSYDLYFNLNFPAGGQPDWLLLGQSRPDPDTNLFAPGMKPQRIDEYTLGYEWLITPTIGVGVKGVYREWDDIITSQFRFDYSTGAPRKITLFTNNSAAEREYRAGILTFEKRFSDNWQMIANYTWSEAEGNVTSEFGFDTFGSYEGVPQTTENRFGRLPWDSEHNFKIGGFYNIPLPSTRHNLSVGARYDYRSGNAYARNNTVVVVVGPGPDGILQHSLGDPKTLGGDDQTDSVTQFFEKRGSHTEPHNQQFDISFNYRFAFNKRVNFEARFEVFNVTSEQSAQAVSTAWFENPTTASRRRTNYLFGAPTAYSQLQTPRSYRAQFAITW